MYNGKLEVISNDESQARAIECAILSGVFVSVEFHQRDKRNPDNGEFIQTEHAMAQYKIVRSDDEQLIVAIDFRTFLFADELPSRQSVNESVFVVANPAIHRIHSLIEAVRNGANTNDLPDAQLIQAFCANLATRIGSKAPQAQFRFVAGSEQMLLVVNNLTPD